MAANSTAQTANAAHVPAWPTDTSHGTCSARPSASLATQYMPSGNARLHRPRS